MISTSASVAVLAGYIAIALASPLEVRATSTTASLATGTCNHDILYRSMVDSRYSSSASAFCSSYIQPTAFATATEFTTGTVTVTATETGIVPRANSPAVFATFPANRLSSACSCILTAAPTTTTVTATTVPIPVTVTATATSYKYVQEWNQYGCGYATANIVDYPQDGLNEQQAIDDCASNCSNIPNCLVFEAYYLIRAGGDALRPRCALFSSPYDTARLLCPVPGYDIGYSFGASKKF